MLTDKIVDDIDLCLQWRMQNIVGFAEEAQDVSAIKLTETLKITHAVKRLDNLIEFSNVGEVSGSYSGGRLIYRLEFKDAQSFSAYDWLTIESKV